MTREETREAAIAKFKELDDQMLIPNLLAIDNGGYQVVVLGSDTNYLFYPHGLKPKGKEK